MFGIGTGEILLILVIAMLVFGPERMVEMSRQAGQMLAKFRAETDDMTKEFREVLSLEPESEKDDEHAQETASAETAPPTQPQAPSQSDFPPKPNLTVGHSLDGKGTNVTETNTTEDGIAAAIQDDAALLIEARLIVGQFDGETEVLDPEDDVDGYANSPDLEPVLIHVAEIVPEDVDVEPTLIEGPVFVMDETNGDGARSPRDDVPGPDDEIDAQDAVVEHTDTQDTAEVDSDPEIPMPQTARVSHDG